MTTPPSTSPTTSPTTLTHLPSGTLRLIRAAWLLVFVGIWGLVVAGIPDNLATGGQVADDILAMFQRLGLPDNFHAYYKVGLDIFSLVVFSSISLLLFVRRSDDWLALFVGMMMMLTAFIYANSTYAEGIWVWVAVAFIAAGETMQVTFFYVFPSGRFIPSWARWLVLPMFIFRYIIWANIYINGAGQGAVEVGIVVLCMAIGFALQIYRFRRESTPAQRQQVKWLLVGLMITVPVVATYIFTVIIFQVFGPRSADNYFILEGLRIAEQIALFIFPTTIVLSILRYRLWDIDVTINRSLVLGLMTVMLAVPFAAVFFGLRAVLESLLGGQQDTMAVAASGLAVGMLYNPAHRQARELIDRRFYRLRFNLLELRASQKPLDLKNPGMFSGRTLGKYSVQELLGKGGMGEVYRGADGDRVAALKILPGGAGGNREFYARFSREAKLTLSLTHPHIVRMFDYGEDQGTAYMAMEYIEGQHLGAYLRQRGTLPAPVAAVVLGQVAQALDYAHAAGFIHRDIKPGNVMLRQQAGGALDAVLMDFGVAKVKESQTMLTGTGVVGTIDYMAPEQIKEATTVDHRADIYALGVVAYELVTGQRPFSGNVAQVMFMHLQQPPPDPREVNEAVPATAAYAILRAMAKDPAHRFETASAFVAAMG
ncbi:MAG: serine/threonine protein kinase [Anaerolineae bacterium]|nr:MAG: serine/threonine protein kinase [Anaerolineae bacterium]